MKWKAEKRLFLMVFSYLKNNQNSRSYRCSNIAKNRVFRTFRLGLLENQTWWTNSEPGFGFYAKNYFGNDYRYFYNNHNLIFCRPVLPLGIINYKIRWLSLKSERPGLESRHSQMHLFLHRKISNSSNLNNKLPWVNYIPVSAEY